MQTMTLPFDPTNGFHDYRFDYAPNSVSFYADGKLITTWSGGVPNNPMRLYVNAWYPTWLEGKKPHTDQTVPVDKVSYAATPVVDAVSPTGGETGVQRNTDVTATFSEEMDPDTLTTSTVQLHQKYWYQVRKKKGRKVRRVWRFRWVPVSAEVSCDSSCRTVTLDPYGGADTLLLPNTTYLATIGTEATAMGGTTLTQGYY